MSEYLEGSELDSDENGLTLVLETDETPEGFPYRLRVTYQRARELLAALEPLREWVAEGERQRVAYDRASPAERAEVLGLDPDDAESGYAPDDPKSPRYADRMLAVGDDRRKATREC